MEIVVSSEGSEWFLETCKREWGEWKVLNNYSNKTKIKELIVLPGHSLSWQKHEYRNELWFIREGTATVHYSMDTQGEIVYVKRLKKHQNFILYADRWHQLSNEGENILSVIEIQFGSNCAESDIVRKPRASSTVE